MIRIALADDIALAARKLAMAAEQRRERAELEPAQVELAPFGQVSGVLFAEAILDRKAADVEGPVGQARHLS